MYRNLINLEEEARTALKTYWRGYKVDSRKGQSTWTIYAISSAIGVLLFLLVLFSVLRRFWGA